MAERFEQQKATLEDIQKREIDRNRKRNRNCYILMYPMIITPNCF